MKKFKNGVALVQVGRVSVLVFNSPEVCKSTGRLLVNGVKGNPQMTRLAMAPDITTVKEMRAALRKIEKDFPLPYKPKRPAKKRLAP